MKKHFEHPTIESCEFVVAARLQSSGGSVVPGGAHSASHVGTCSKTASQGSKACALPSNPTSAGGNLSC